MTAQFIESSASVSSTLLIEAMAAAGFADEAERIQTVRTHVRDQLAGDIAPERIIEQLKQARRASDIADAQENPFAPLDLGLAIGEAPPTWSTGLPWWDSAMADGGMQAGWKIVLAAPPGCGKTALVMQVLRGFLRNHPNAQALYLAGEMSRRQLAMRLVQQEANLPAYALSITGKTHAEKLANAMRRLADISPRLHIMDPPIDIARLRDRVHLYPLVVVDYLQLCKPSDLSAGRVEQLDQIMVDFTTIAANVGTTFIIISAMPRGSATTKSRNIFEAFKGTSAIEYAADVAFVGEVDEDQNGGEWREVRWRCLKNRHAAAVDLDLKFYGPSMRFDRVIRQKPTAEPPKPVQAQSYKV